MLEQRTCCFGLVPQGAAHAFFEVVAQQARHGVRERCETEHAGTRPVLEPRDGRRRRVALPLVEPGSDEAALSEPRLPDHHEGASRTTADVLVRRIERCKIARAPHERGRVLRGPRSCRTHARRLPLDPPRARFAFAQHRDEVGGRRETSVGLGGNQGVHDRLEERRRRGHGLAQPRQRCIREPAREQGTRAFGLRMPPHDQLVQQEPKCVQVAARVHPTGAELLRRCVEQGADELAGLGQAQRLFLDERHAEVHHLHRLVRCDDDVLGLHVAVHDAGGMDRGQGIGHGGANLARQALGHATGLLEQRAQRRALDVLEHEVRHLGAFVLGNARLDRVYDPGMLDAQPRLDLAQEARKEPRTLE